MQWRRGGLTLVELVVVIVIITACVTVVFPRFSSGWLEQQRFLSCVSKITSIVEYTHQRAISTSLTHMLHIDIEKGTYWVTAHTPDSKLVPMADGINLSGRLPDDIRFAGVEFQDKKGNSGDVVTIEFSPQGWIDAATLYLASREGNQMGIVIHEMLGYVETFEVL